MRLAGRRSALTANRKKGPEDLMHPKLPALQRLRIARAHAERPIREPLEAEIRRGASMIRELGHQLQQLKAFMGKEIAKHVTAQIGHECGALLKREIGKALAVAGRGDDGQIVKMEFAVGDLRWSDPQSLERRVLEDWKERSAPRLRVSFPVDGATAMEATTVQTIDVRLPELGYRRHIME